MKARLLIFLSLLSMSACGDKSSDPAAPVAADSAQFTALKTIMNDNCASCHTTAWVSSEASFKASLTSIQSQVASGKMPPAKVLTSDEKAKFASYPN